MATPVSRVLNTPTWRYMHNQLLLSAASLASRSACAFLRLKFQHFFTHTKMRSQKYFEKNNHFNNFFIYHLHLTQENTYFIYKNMIM